MDLLLKYNFIFVIVTIFMFNFFLLIITNDLLMQINLSEYGNKYIYRVIYTSTKIESFLNV